VNANNCSIKVVNRAFTAADIEELSITLNIRSEGLEHLTNEETAAKFRSKDTPAAGENKELVEKQIKAVYDRINRSPEGEMASLAARFSGIYRSDSKLLCSYGDIVLVMDWRKIARDIVIFNGYVKNLGAKLLGSEFREGAGSHVVWNDWLRWFTVPGIDLDSEITSTKRQLEELWARSTVPRAMPPRVVGKYCEARLFRALRPTDVAKVFVPDVAHSELNLIIKLQELKVKM
jgi:hypothetical protein